jgi:hypothetical protein
MELYPAEVSHFEHDFIEFEDEKVPVSDLKYYEGTLVDEKDSHVKGAIIDGIFIGEVNSKRDGVYYIESAKRHENVKEAHSIIYHESDINSNEEIKRARRDMSSYTSDEEEEEGVGCGSHKRSVRELLEKRQKVFTEEIEKTKVIRTYVLEEFFLNTNDTRVFTFVIIPWPPRDKKGVIKRYQLF